MGLKSCNGIHQGVDDLPHNVEGAEQLGDQGSAPRPKEWGVVAEKVVVGVLMVVVWMLLLLPIIFYHLPVDNENAS